MTIAYRYVAPTTERHQVEWMASDLPGVFQRERPLFASLRLVPVLSEWLDDNAAGWTFRSSPDINEPGLDGEECLLIVPSETAGIGFIRQATEVSEAWVAADRAAMRYVMLIRTPGLDEIEAARSHFPFSRHETARILFAHGDYDRGTHRRLSETISATSEKLRDLNCGRTETILPSSDMTPAGTVVVMLKTGPTPDGMRT